MCFGSRASAPSLVLTSQDKERKVKLRAERIKGPNGEISCDDELCGGIGRRRTILCVRIMARSHARQLLVHTCVRCQKLEDAFRSLSGRPLSLYYLGFERGTEPNIKTAMV